MLEATWDGVCSKEFLAGSVGDMSCPREPVFAPNKSRLLSDRCTCPFLIEITPAAVSSGYGVIRNGQELESWKTLFPLDSCTVVVLWSRRWPSTALFLCVLLGIILLLEQFYGYLYSIDPNLMASDRLWDKPKFCQEWEHTSLTIFVFSSDQNRADLQVAVSVWVCKRRDDGASKINC